MTPFHPGFHPRAILKLQTARFRTPEELQTRDLDQKKRLDELYLAIGGLGGQKLELDPKIAKKLIFVTLKTFKRLVLAPQDSYRPQEKLVYTVFDVESEFRG